MSEVAIEPKDRVTVLVHYYRAMVGRADIWRMRMDATSNWAIGATAAVISFSLGNPEAPHFVVHIASILTLGFLLLEARRLTFYHLWQQRVLLLETGWIRPAIAPRAAGENGMTELAAKLGPHLGKTVPTMSLWKATARRLRRIYLYLFAVQLAAWGLKLASHPTSTGRLDDIVARAQVWTLSGEVVLGAAVLVFVALLVLALALGGVDRQRD
jgi:uncharacterized membrane protein